MDFVLPLVRDLQCRGWALVRVEEYDQTGITAFVLGELVAGGEDAELNWSKRISGIAATRRLLEVASATTWRSPFRSTSFTWQRTSPTEQCTRKSWRRFAIWGSCINRSPRALQKQKNG